ncbi:hypothetical protein J5N97_028375 [Dioscorea zingiberensis]|uniref:Protein kinase domain-containing protein n=1 Tax=Dioscorea zingiberensis TaxID=325984 RepID=A0A9D5BYV2_9LILI|nr:hypothetical protein J5N97_028375 [Dioscorea zingiberensis]
MYGMQADGVEQGCRPVDSGRSRRRPGRRLGKAGYAYLEIAADVAQGLNYIHHHSAASSPHGNRHVQLQFLHPHLLLRSRGSLRRDPDEFTGYSPRLIQGTTGYMAPEVVVGGRISQSSDAFAFGVVLLKLLSNKKTMDTISLIETTKVAIGAGDKEAENVVRSGRVRRWMYGWLRDSFPVALAEKLVRLAPPMCGGRADFSISLSPR